MTDMTKDTSPPAFPVPDGEAANFGCHGLTKREYIAIAAMQGILASLSSEVAGFALSKAADARGMQTPEYIAAFAVEHADALLAALGE